MGVCVDVGVDGPVLGDVHHLVVEAVFVLHTGSDRTGVVTFCKIIVVIWHMVHLFLKIPTRCLLYCAFERMPELWMEDVQKPVSRHQLHLS